MKKWSFYTSDEIKAKGWLYEQLKIQAEGLSGNLDKMWPDVRDSAWIGGKCEGWERVPYWLDGFIPLAYLLEDEDMIVRAKKYIDAIVSRQEDDGWICPCSKAKRSTYDTWAVELITKVLVVYYECSKDERIPEVIYKALKNYYELLKSGKIHLFNWGKFRWFEIFIAIDFTYKRTNEAWLQDLAKIMKKQGQDYDKLYDEWKKPRRVWRFKTHIVNLAMMLKSEAVSCELLGEEYTDLAEKRREILKKYNGTVTEMFTGDECLGGISPIRGTELCSVVEQMYSYELLYAYTGDKKWAERLEVLAFNALPATISDDMWTHQYDQMTNQIACKKFPFMPTFGTNWRRAHLFGLEPQFGCCTANFNQGWPKFALSTFMHNDNRIINAIPVPSELTADAGTISLETEYPFRNTLKYIISANKDFEFEVRIPSFAKNVIVNGENHNEEEFVFNIKKGDNKEIVITFETKAEFREYPLGLNFVKYGSLVFSVPIKAKKVMYEYTKKRVERKFPYCDYELLPESDWNYGFSSTDLSVCEKNVSNVPFSSENPPITVKATVRKINWKLATGYGLVCAKTPKSLVPISEETKIDLYPYGCSKLRMTVLPFVNK